MVHSLNPTPNFWEAPHPQVEEAEAKRRLDAARAAAEREEAKRQAKEEDTMF